MKGTRALLFAVLVVVSMGAAPAAGGVDASAGAADATGGWAPTIAQDDDRDGEATTEGTIGYVEGRWYDDELDVDNSDGLDERELEAVVHRSMARVEVVRNRTFETDVDVDVVTREQFRRENEEDFASGTETDRLYQNVRFETLFMVDRETDATEEFGALYGGSVGGYYDPETDQIVVVSDTPDSPQMDERVLGHELVHALQDQHFDLTNYNATTRDGANAESGLIEGDASWVEREYESRCEGAWNCVLPSDEQAGSGQPPNWGLYFTIFHPYSDGPTFVDHLRDRGGWTAVDAAYDDPPTSSSEIIRPDEYGEFEPREIDIEDRSSDRWNVIEPSEGPAHSTFGESTMVSMFVNPAYQSGGRTQIIPPQTFLTGDDFDPLDYDHEYTDGWAGDRMLAYATDAETIDETGYVWQTEWRSSEDAEQFLDAYGQLLEFHGVESVGDRENTYRIDEGYPGAYHVEQNGTTVTIVRAPSVAELSEIRAGVGDGNATDSTPDDDETPTDGTDGETPTDDADDETPGVGPGGALVALVVGALGTLVARRR